MKNTLRFFFFFFILELLWFGEELFGDKNQCHPIANACFQYDWRKKSRYKCFVTFFSELLISWANINSSWISIAILFNCPQLVSQWLFQHVSISNHLTFQSLNQQPHSTKINEVLSKTLYHLVYRKLNKTRVFLLKRKKKLV